MAQPLKKDSPTPAAGYLTDVPYIYEYFEVLSPLHLKFAAALNGYQTTSLAKPYNYLELGCGNGVSLLMHAMANPHANFYGVDLMPQHIEFAQNIAKECNIKNLTLIQSAFHDVDLKKIPECDFITTHGVVSWISPTVHEDLRNIVKQKLKTGGLYYVSYNTLPGWADRSPIQELLQNFNDHNTNAQTRLKQGFALMSFLKENKAGYFRDNPRANKELERMKKHDPAYLVHEYMHENWKPFYFRESLKFYNDIGLRYVGSASYIENYLDLISPKEFHEFLRKQKFREFRESLLDFIRNSSFRRDIFIKDSIRVADENKIINLFDDIYFTSLRDLPEGHHVVKTPSAEIDFKGPIYEFLREELKDKSVTLTDLEKRASKKKIETGQLVKFLMLFITFGEAIPSVQRTDNKITDVRRKTLQKMNETLIEQLTPRQHKTGKDPMSLVSDVLGGGMTFSQNTTQCLLALMKNNFDETKALNYFTDKATKNKKTISDADKAKLKKLITEVNSKVVPVAKRLGIL